MRRWIYIFLSVFVTMMCLASCGTRRHVIPRKDLTDIYVDLFLADGWYDTHIQYRRAADTTDFYGPILKKYGYTSEDYRASVEYYLRDPDRFSRIFKNAASKIGKSVKVLETREGELREIQDLLRIAAKFAPKMTMFSEFMAQGPLPTDTIAFRKDSITGAWLIARVARDTMYLGPRMYVRADTTARDSTLVDSVVIKPAVQPEIVRLEKPAPIERTPDQKAALKGIKLQEE